MATEYRFLDSSRDIDVSAITDRVSPQETFFVNEIRNEDSEDILEGIALDIHLYTEKELIDLAIEKNVTLLRISEKDGLEEINSITVLYGVFNATTSSLLFQNLVFTNGTNLDGEIHMELEVQFSEADLAAINSNGYSNILANTVGQYTGMELNPSSYVPGTLSTGFRGQLGGTSNLSHQANVDFHPDVWYKLGMKGVDDSGGSNIRMYVDEVEVGSNSQAGAVGNTNAGADYMVGVQEGAAVTAFPGKVRNVLISLQGGASVLVDIKDPFTGVNEGSEADGIPTDITR